MKKTLSCIALLMVMLVGVSAHTERVFQASEGFKAPELKIEKSGFSLADLRGHYVLVNFWASTDAESRMSAMAFDKAIDEAQAQHLRHVSVNLDTSEPLFREIVRRDGLDQKTQMHVDASRLDKIAGDWYLDNGFRSFLIDPEGTIVAVNPSISTLKAIASL